jgi:transcriptional regulator with XRE-family HTH domain
VSDSQLREAICSEVARLLKDLRIKRKLSMTELAARAGLSRAMISFVEHELRNPTLETLLRIAAVLEVDLAKVLEKASAGAAKNLGSCRKLTSKFKS